MGRVREGDVDQSLRSLSEGVGSAGGLGQERADESAVIA
ncbi:hypothetical protein MYFR107205_25500 [Mycolicibacterium frederiksbergense]